MIHRSEFPFHELSVEERLLLVEEIWDSIAAERESVPLTDAQRIEIRRRLAEHRAHPERAVSWEDAKSRVQARLDEMRSQ